MSFSYQIWKTVRVACNYAFPRSKRKSYSTVNRNERTTFTIADNLCYSTGIMYIELTYHPHCMWGSNIARRFVLHVELVNIVGTSQVRMKSMTSVRQALRWWSIRVGHSCALLESRYVCSRNTVCNRDSMQCRFYIKRPKIFIETAIYFDATYDVDDVRIFDNIRY